MYHVPTDIKYWASLARILNRSWFERLWVIQELEAANRALVRSGDVTVAWETLEMAVSFLYTSTSLHNKRS